MGAGLCPGTQEIEKNKKIKSCLSRRSLARRRINPACPVKYSIEWSEADLTGVQNLFVLRLESIPT
jgi:hypothetical protein